MLFRSEGSEGLGVSCRINSAVDAVQQETAFCGVVISLFRGEVWRGGNKHELGEGKIMVRIDTEQAASCMMNGGAGKVMLN